MTSPDSPPDWSAARAQPLGPAAAPLDADALGFPPPSAPPRRNRTGLIVALVAVAAVVLAGLGAGAALVLTHHSSGSGSPATAASSGTIDVQGSLRLTDSSGVLNLDGVSCSGMGGYSDVTGGAQIVVTDEAGTVVATSSLGKGQMIGSGVYRTCLFPFDIPGVPTGKKFYGVAISHRGVLQYTETEMRSGPNLTLG